jgi:hypothetical protein
MIGGALVSVRSLALVSIAVLALSGCGGWGERPLSEPTVTIESTVTASPSPDASPSPTPMPTMAPDDSRSPDPATAPEPGDTVSPEFFISEVDEANAEYFTVVYVRGIFETGGTCTVTVKANGETSTQESTAETDASGTACGSFTFDVSKFGSGEATVTASYESANYQGVSDELKVQLP